MFYRFYIQLFLAKSVTIGSSLARNRWLVAYTLIRNPTLQKLTANWLKKGEESHVDNQQYQLCL